MIKNSVSGIANGALVLVLMLAFDAPTWAAVGVAFVAAQQWTTREER